MSGEEILQRLTAVERNVSADMDKIMLKLGSSANAMIYERIYQTGMNAQNQPFLDYTDKYKKFKSKSKSKDPTKTGHYRGFVDLTYSGGLWLNIRFPTVKSTTADHKAGKVIIGPDGDKYREILTGLHKGNKNLRARGPILDLSIGEVDILQGLVDVWVNDIVKKNGL